MKRLLILLLFISINGYSQTSDFQWAVGAGGSSWGLTRCVTTDGEKNVYIVGYFQSRTITFGSILLTNTDQSSLTDDLYIVKYDSLGNVLWAKNYGGKDDDYAIGISISQSGDLLISGGFTSNKISFGTTTLINYAEQSFF